MIMTCCGQFNRTRPPILLLILALINYGRIAEASCSHTIYIMPLYADSTVLSEFDNLEKYFSECQNRAFEEDMHTSLRVLSLRSKTKLFDCTVGDDCSSKFNNPDTFNDTKLLHEHFMINLNTVYNMTDFIQSNLKKDCLENSVLIIPTNLRCIHAEKYPDFWSLIGELDSTINNFIIRKKLSTNVLWINYNYLSPTDNVGCELDYLLKQAGSPLITSTSDKDGTFFMEDTQVGLCKQFNEQHGPVLSKPLLIVVVVICTLVLLLCLACIVLCVLKVKYRYKILKMDFLFRRQNKQDEELPANNYYKVNGGADEDKWELSMGELDIDFDNVLGSGAFAYVVQATLIGQRNNGVSGGVNMFNGNLVAVKIMHSTADELARANFMREIELMKSFNSHAHILNLIGCISDPENPMLVSELCEIGDLRHILVAHKPHDIFEDRPQCEQSGVTCLRGKDLTSFAWQVSDALCYLSSKQFVHKDIAARNVFITKALVAKLGDFGLCHSLDPLSSLHTAPQGKFPMKWTALEALQNGTFSEKSDVWSYGVLLFEMYTGASMPFPTIEADDLKDALASGVRPEIPDDVPENMRLIMTSCWVENPEERPTFEEIRTRLTSLLDVCSQAYGYIQFSQQTANDNPSAPTTPTSKQIPPLTIQKEVEGKYGNDELNSVQELEVH